MKSLNRILICNVFFVSNGNLFYFYFKHLVFYKGTTLAFQHIKSLLKGVYPKRKEFAPHGSKFFPFRVDYFSKGRDANSFLLNQTLFKGRGAKSFLLD